MADIAYINELVMSEKGKPTELKRYNVAYDYGKTLARAYLTSNQTVNHDTWTTISGYTENFDIGSNFASDKYTAPVTGYYHVDFQARLYDAGSELTYGAIVLFKNNAANVSVVAGEVHTDSSIVTIGSSTLCYLTAGDYLDIRVYGLLSAGSGDFVAYAGSENTYISVHLIST